MKPMPSVPLREMFDVPRIPVVANLADVVQILVEHFDAVAFAVDDVEVLLRVHGELVRQIPLARPVPLSAGPPAPLPTCLMNFPVLSNRIDAVVAVAVGHDHVAVVQNRDPRRQIQMRRVVALLVRRPELQQELIQLRDSASRCGARRAR